MPFCLCLFLIISYIHVHIHFNCLGAQHLVEFCLRLIKLKLLQDSCNEANTPDHTAETCLVVNENPVEKNDGDHNLDMLSDLFEKLFHLNKKLEEQEDDIFR